MKPISIGLDSVAHFELLDRGAVFRARRRNDEAAALDRQLDGAAVLGRDRRHAVHRLGEGFAIDLEDLVVVGRDHAVVIGEGAVDQLRGQRRLADRTADLGLAQRDLDLLLGLALIDQLSELEHGLARHDDARHPGRAFGQR